MKTIAFAHRCRKEILRDPLNLFFGLGFPGAVLLLLSVIQANIPVPLFEISHLAPGITVFGLSFMTLFSATLIAKDRESTFLQRLYTLPLRPANFILGYLLPMIPIALIQGAVCYGLAIALGLPVTINILYALVILVIISILYISLGLLCGSLLQVKQVGGICGALLTNLSAWLSGIWFDLNLMGEAFRKIANLLPFVHAVELERAMVSGNFHDALPHLLPVIGYAAVITATAILVFLRKMHDQ